MIEFIRLGNEKPRIRLDKLCAIWFWPTSCRKPTQDRWPEGMHSNHVTQRVIWVIMAEYVVCLTFTLYLDLFLCND